MATVTHLPGGLTFIEGEPCSVLLPAFPPTVDEMCVRDCVEQVSRDADGEPAAPGLWDREEIRGWVKTYASKSRSSLLLSL